jgi:hypothetical protein
MQTEQNGRQDPKELTGPKRTYRGHCPETETANYQQLTVIGVGVFAPPLFTQQHDYQKLIF